MANNIKKGESLLIPFRNGSSIFDSQMKPRMYKTMQAFEKSFPGIKDGVELVEYVEVVRCKNCKRWRPWTDKTQGMCPCSEHVTKAEHFCSYGERKDNG